MFHVTIDQVIGHTVAFSCSYVGGNRGSLNRWFDFITNRLFRESDTRLHGGTIRTYERKRLQAPPDGHHCRGSRFSEYPISTKDDLTKIKEQIEKDVFSSRYIRILEISYPSAMHVCEIV